MSSKISYPKELVPALSTQTVSWADLMAELDKAIKGKFIQFTTSMYVLVNNLRLDGFGLLYDGLTISIPEPSIDRLGATVERKYGEFLGDAAGFVRMLYEGRIEECTEHEILEKIEFARSSLKTLTDFGFKVLEVAK